MLGEHRVLRFRGYASVLIRPLIAEHDRQDEFYGNESENLRRYFTVAAERRADYAASGRFLLYLQRKMNEILVKIAPKALSR